jgi:hypothetical protein
VLISAIRVLFAGAAEEHTFGIKGGINFTNIINLSRPKKVDKKRG